MLKTIFFIKQFRWLPLLLIVLAITQACSGYRYNYRSRGYMHTPPSTGHNRCGCLLPEKQDNKIDYACIHVQKD